MTTGTIHTIRIARPDDDEMALFWKLYYAAQRVEDRWCRNTVGPIAEELVNTELSRQEKLFLLRAWQVLVDGIGGFGRLMSAYDTYVYNMQDPGDDCIAYKPSLQQLFADAELLPVVMDAYAEAMAELKEVTRQRDNAERSREYWKNTNADLTARVIATEVNLANREAQPVAWLAIYHGEVYDEAISITRSVVEAQADRFGWESALTEIIPLYRHAPPAPAVTSELLEAMNEVIRISDRDHEAWDRAKEAIAACRVAKPAQPVGYLVPGFNRDFKWGYAYLFPQSGGGADIPVYLAVPAASPVIHDQSEPDAIDVFVDQVCGDLTAGHQH
ncbi:hypothetical protein MNO11_15530 [Serratia plymuthica]|uniref:hypothetical protein n=1 Tax=Serratia plymuthica TaxID=82996 RepID=UPI001F53A4EB|nr:hypothetical protein [Serratia plymuthica]UNK26257.1 hypothetical protein MNO11_15530 [Serratia plymuthica]